MPTEFSWLVENGKQGHLLEYRSMDERGIHWTANPHKAIRFSRRADAEMFAAGDEDAWAIVQHGFEVGDGTCTCSRDYLSCQVHALEKEQSHDQIPRPQAGLYAPADKAPRLMSGEGSGDSSVEIERCSRCGAPATRWLKAVLAEETGAKHG